MRDELLGYYERELGFLRRLGAEFAEKYPKIAARLQLERDKCEDPHVERMIEAAAFLAARVQLKLDDEFPQVTESLLDVLYPGYLAPIPSLSVVQFAVDPARVSLQAGQTIPRGATVASRPVRGTPCRFRTCYPVTVWPLELAGAHFDLPAAGSALGGGASRSVLKMAFRSFPGVSASDLKRRVSESEEKPLSSLRMFLLGEPRVVQGLYELLFNSARAVELRYGPAAAPRSVVLPPDSLKPVGFSRDETLLPLDPRSFPGFRLVQEYFAFPEKFLFFDLAGLERLAGQGAKEGFEVWIHFDREFVHEKAVDEKTFRLNATPVVNLFRKVCEPIALTGLKSEYPLVPDVRAQTAHEIWTIGSVVATSPGREEAVTYEPFYSFRHGGSREEPRTFWYGSRRPSGRKDDEGTEIFLSLVDLDFEPARPVEETLTVEALCSNRDLPGDLPFGAAEGDFQLEGPGVYSAIRCLVKPTKSRRPPLKRRLQWRLVSHLALNHLSLVPEEGSGEPEALREILRLYDTTESAVSRQQIAGISRISARRVLRSIGASHASYVRGLELSLELDEAQFIGSGVYLFGSILERFLGLYASINSFTQLVLSTRQREGVVKRWPPRSGEAIVL